MVERQHDEERDDDGPEKCGSDKAVNKEQVDSTGCAVVSVIRTAVDSGPVTHTSEPLRGPSAPRA